MMQRTKLPWLRRGQHHAQVHLPPLTAEEALLLVNLLERFERAVWRAHGDAMAEFIGARGIEAEHDPEPGDTTPLTGRRQTRARSTP
jgi:hypothetical protein